MESVTLVRDDDGETEVWEVTWAGLDVEVASGIESEPLRTKTKKFRTHREAEEWIRAELAKRMKDGFKIRETATPS
ncbi:MAG: hypothetical protein H6709_16820 [Kofleriaceae bacterium]|nr:hypothetical protein [Myxococcales bacterium]MCB9561707.1 hypothetical protein [Kofleriaceae bacterium]MCB9573744.1 hypothetical protein [Kofleriaceae bacterium]